jgi:hypothetical protein
VRRGLSRRGGDHGQSPRAPAYRLYGVACQRLRARGGRHPFRACASGRARRHLARSVCRAVYARDILHVGPIGLGFLRSAPAAGSALVALSFAYRPLERHAGSWMFASVAIFGLSTIVFGRSTSFYLSLAALFVLGASDMVSVFVRSALIQFATPDRMRGRVSAVNMLFIGGSNELGEFESGVTAAWFGTVPAVIIGGLGTLGIVGIWMWLFPPLLKVDRLMEVTET